MMSEIQRTYAAAFQSSHVTVTTPIRGTSQVTVNLIPQTSSNGTLL